MGTALHMLNQLLAGHGVAAARAPPRPQALPRAPPARGYPGPPPPAPPQNSRSPSGALQEALDWIGHCQATGHQPDDSEITWVVETRERLRHKKDFQGADAVREKLMSTLGVEIIQKENRWSA